MTTLSKARQNALYADSIVDVRDYGAVGDGVTDDTSSIQSAIDHAFDLAGGEVVFPAGSYKVTSTLELPANTAGAIKLRGLGHRRSMLGGVNGDPTGTQGAEIKYTGSTGNIFSSSISSANTRQYIGVESMAFVGNSGGTSGHGIYFYCSNSSSAIVYEFRNVTVTACKQSGILCEGNVFESSLYSVRSQLNGECGFKAAISGSGIPGEIRFFGCKFDSNDIGLDLSGGGKFSLFGTGAGGNSTSGMNATSVRLGVFDGQFEGNGLSAGNGVVITNCFSPLFFNVLMTVVSGAGNGIKFVNCVNPQIHGFSSNSGASDPGYSDLYFDSTTTRSEVTGYFASDFTERVTYAGQGGHLRRQGGYWLTGQPRGTMDITVTAATTYTPNASQCDQIQVTATAAVAYTIANPTMFTNFHRGQILTFHIYNNSGGAITTSFGASYHLSGAWTDPANTKTRTITFSYNETRSGWFEVSRSSSDIT